MTTAYVASQSQSGRSSGIEPLVWLTDVGGLDTQEAVEQMVWSAKALVRQADRET